ncbi:hypothetical protein [Paludisphaera soli]|uniref:hypothetical protein n=1 Tax=Paludisphaera soli TaxID=2712865 RepID=UPI0013ED891A|nr:hypothetical protein [Paludisphaera soli]
MERRLEISRFSMTKMRSLLGSGDRAAIERIDRPLEINSYEWPANRLHARRVLEAAILHGVPFPAVGMETVVHFQVAVALALDDQDHFWTEAAYHTADRFEFELRRMARRHAGVRTRRILNGIARGLPLFGLGTIEGGAGLRGRAPGQAPRAPAGAGRASRSHHRR